MIQNQCLRLFPRFERKIPDWCLSPISRQRPLPRRLRPRQEPPRRRPRARSLPQGPPRPLISTAELLNQLLAAQTEHRLKAELKKILRPDLLILDELGYIPIDKHGADLLFQVVSQRYERGSIILTSNKTYKDWPPIFNNDNTVTAAILDRLLHQSQTITISGSSYRMGTKTQI